jgi:hypothetical protein
MYACVFISHCHIERERGSRAGQDGTWYVEYRIVEEEGTYVEVEVEEGT